jgi:DNA invertase Pin-like site-specific DNA recombinase
MLGFLAIFAELQREDIRRRTKVALAGKRARGEAFNRAPLGVQIVGKRYVQDPATWPVVARILSERSAGASCESIAEGLNAAGISTATGAGIWHAAGVASLCRSEAVKRAASCS